MKTNKDTDLREALRRRYANTPSLPTDFTERLMERMDTKPAVSHRRHWWGWMSAAAACLLIAIGLGVYHELNKASQPIAKSDTSNQTIGHVQSINRTRPINQSGRTNQAIEAHQLSNRGAPIEQSGRTKQALGHARQRFPTRSAAASGVRNGTWRLPFRC